MARALDDGSGAMGGAMGHGGSYGHGTLVIPGRTGRMSLLAQSEANGACTESALQRDVLATRFGMVSRVPSSSRSPSPSPVERGGAAAAAAAAAALDRGAQADEDEESPHGRRRLGGRIVVDPPDLQAWRERLFNVDEEIILTNDE